MEQANAGGGVSMTDRRETNNGRERRGRINGKRAEDDDLRTDPKGEDFIRDDVRLGGAVEDIGATAGQHGERIGELAEANREDVARATGNARNTRNSARKRKR